MDNNGNVVLTKEQAEFTLIQAISLIRIIYNGVEDSKMEELCNSLGVSVADFNIISNSMVKVV